jgi:hypothetical protein
MLYAIFYVPLFLYVMTLIYQNNLERIREQDRRLEDEIREVEADIDAIIDNTISTEGQRSKPKSKK